MVLYSYMHIMTACVTENLELRAALRPESTALISCSRVAGEMCKGCIEKIL